MEIPQSGLNGMAIRGSLDIRFSEKRAGFRCPVCRDQDLAVANVADTQAACCGGCRGLLIDSVSLGAIIQSLRATYRGSDDRPHPLNAGELNGRLMCPVCRNAMYTHPYHGPGNVVINSCSGCQLTWLDDGELASIIQAPGRRMPSN
jgi:Zn-finger nucleic acid-binding protein